MTILGLTQIEWKISSNLQELLCKVNLQGTHKIQLTRWLEKDIWMLRPGIWREVEFRVNRTENLLLPKMSKRRKDLHHSQDLFLNQKLKKNLRFDQISDLRQLVNKYNLRNNKLQYLLHQDLKLNPGKMSLRMRTGGVHREMPWIWQLKATWTQQPSMWRLMVKQAKDQVDTLQLERILQLKRNLFHRTGLKKEFNHLPLQKSLKLKGKFKGSQLVREDSQ